MLTLLLCLALLPLATPQSRGRHDNRDAVPAGNAEFAVSLYKTIARTSPENVILSPFSVSVALAMTSAGAAGRTLSQMSDVLGFRGLTQDVVHAGFRDIRQALVSPDRSPTTSRPWDVDLLLYVANGLFGQQSLRYQPGFQRTCQQSYSAQLQSLDFSGDTEGSRRTVNDWVSNATRQLIRDLLPPGSVTSQTRLILANAVYFHAEWQNKFNTIRPLDFHLSTGRKVKLPFMFLEDDFHYGYNRSLACRVLKLPYQGGAGVGRNTTVAMYVLLPTGPSTNLDRLETRLTGDMLYNVETRFRMRSRKVKVRLPKFKYDGKKSLKTVLIELGMVDAFSQQSADFSGISGAGQQPLFVSDVIHAASVNVNENGTTAAAATAIIMAGRSLKIERNGPVIFKADRPFIFFIQDETSKSILFLGRFAAPA